MKHKKYVLRQSDLYLHIITNVLIVETHSFSPILPLVTTSNFQSGIQMPIGPIPALNMKGGCGEGN